MGAMEDILITVVIQSTPLFIQVIRIMVTVDIMTITDITVITGTTDTTDTMAITDIMDTREGSKTGDNA